MKTVIGSITNHLKTTERKFIVIPFEPHPRKYKLTGAGKALMKKRYVDLSSHPPNSKTVQYHYNREGCYDIYYFLMPVRKWKPKQKRKQPIDLEMLESSLRRIKDLVAGADVAMPFPESYSTRERSLEVMECIQKNSWDNLILYLIKPLPHQQPHRLVRMDGENQCSPPSVASEPQPAPRPLSDALR